MGRMIGLVASPEDDDDDGRPTLAFDGIDVKKSSGRRRVSQYLSFFLGLGRLLCFGKFARGSAAAINKKSVGEK